MEVLTHKETQGCKHTNAAMLQFSLAVEEQSPLRDARGDFEWIKEAHWRSLPNTLQHVICTGQYFGVTCPGHSDSRPGFQPMPTPSMGLDQEADWPWVPL